MLAFFVIIVCYCFILFTNRCKCRKKIKIDQKKQEVAPKETDSLVDSDDEGQWTSHKLSNTKSSTQAQGMKKVEKAISKTDWRLALVPLIFLLFRFWGNLRHLVILLKALVTPFYLSSFQEI
ncbi:PREDICTED: uncharacterized protein LOC105316804 isoform X1 [Amphimedon queenslandica]|uniref:Uncharacterized protein n=1 Tax=Amphimedon queenslandica TaxID=400682 RepID=A0AAN0IW10_AMPQE|nr:PREDICTED: uncharacterized protein LOC105316804 isoform X1 [Amphimedon queenslandica]|eukprot:XP_019849000.1 PREDICTED: uncharacterized protein LOC105316804 isoform X1 [Amphimedon queenslandica]